MINVAIVGCGRMGRRHALAYQANSKVKINGFYDINKTLAKKIAKQFDSKPIESLNQIFVASNIDAISICTPNSMHYNILKKAVEFDKHVLVEKPIVTTENHCNRIVKMMKRAKSKIMVGHIHRFFPCNLALKSSLERNEIGSPILINTFDYIPGRIPNEKMPTWVKNKKFSGGGIFMTDLIHTVDKIAWWNNSTIKKVFVPTLSNKITKGRVEDVGIANLWLDDGTVASCVHGCPSPGSSDMSTRIIGTDGELILEFAGSLISVKKTKTDIDYKNKDNYLKQSQIAFTTEISEFIQSILQDREPSVNYVDGIKAVRVILALYESFRIGKPVKVSY